MSLKRLVKLAKNRIKSKGSTPDERIFTEISLGLNLGIPWVMDSSVRSAEKLIAHFLTLTTFFILCPRRIFKFVDNGMYFSFFSTYYFQFF